MYKFKDHCDDLYLLTDSDDHDLVCLSEIDSAASCTLTREQASGLAVRLQFFANHGRLPREEHSWTPPPDDWEPPFKVTFNPLEDVVNIGPKSGPFTRPDEPASPKPVTFSNPPQPKMPLISELEKHFLDEEDVVIAAAAAADKNTPEPKVYVVTGVDEDSCGARHSFTVGVFDSFDKAKKEMEDYRWHHEPDEGYYDLDIEEFNFNKIDSNE